MNEKKGGYRVGLDSWSKLAVIIFVGLASIILGLYDKIDSQALVALLSAAMGYVYGNGHGIMAAQRAEKKGSEK